MIDLNCDVGESFEDVKIGQDEAVIPFITSANIACGFHGGDPRTMQATVEAALEHGVQIGAHPAGIRDLKGFGRTPFTVSPVELADNLKFQLATLRSVTERCGGSIRYVKAHGALYHLCQQNAEVAVTLVQTVKAFDPNLGILAALHPQLVATCDEQGVRLIAEGFADRKYSSAATLVSRAESGSVLERPEEVCDQALALATGAELITNQEEAIYVPCRSICLHGDHPHVAESLRLIRSRFAEHDVSIVPF